MDKNTRSIHSYLCNFAGCYSVLNQLLNHNMQEDIPHETTNVYYESIYNPKDCIYFSYIALNTCSKLVSMQINFCPYIVV